MITIVRYNIKIYYEILQVTLSCSCIILEMAKHFKNLAMFALQGFESMFGHFSTLSMKGLNIKTTSYLAREIQSV